MSSESNKQKWDWSQFSSITNAKDMMEYLKDRPYGHGQYCHYTKPEIINSIIKNETFWISSVNGANDERDKSQFAGQENEYYMLCWSTGINENLPMWYMYGGVKGTGGRLRLTKESVKKLNEEGVYELYKKDGEKLGSRIMELKNGVNMKCEFQDILYMRTNAHMLSNKKRKTNAKNDEYAEIKYNTMINRKMPLPEQEIIRKERVHFIKSLIWFYEKETRLLVQLTGEAKEAVQDGKEYVVTLSFPKKGKFNINIDLAPEVDIDDDKFLQKYPNICDRSTSISVHPSEYYKEPHMDLCRKCEYKEKRPNNSNDASEESH